MDRALRAVDVGDQRRLAALRFWTQFSGFDETRRAAEPAKCKAGLEALSVMETRLTAHPFLAADCFTAADIALFAYTHVAGQAGFDLADFPAIEAWLERVKAEEGFTPMVFDRGRMLAPEVG